MQKLISKYNQSDTLLVISTYPKKGQVYTAGMGGVASYTKNNLLPLTKKGQKVVVLADKENDEFLYEEEGILVIRCWKRGDWKLFASLFSWVKRFSKIRAIEVQFEFALYDGLFKTLFFPVFLFLLKLLGKRVILVLHQVIFDLGELSGHLGWKRKSFYSSLFSKGVALFYRFICLFSDKVVVLESVFAGRLKELGVSQNKIRVVPHGVDSSLSKVPIAKAKKLLGIAKSERVILSFGFLTWYKGSDILVKKFAEFVKKHPHTRLRLILAGGESQTQKDKKHYQNFIKKLYARAKNCSKVKITGYVPEDKIPLYFGAADLVVFPYRTLMSSSGPLSLAFSFGVPFAVSYPLSDIFETFDCQWALAQSGLRKKDLIFEGFENLAKFEKNSKVAKLIRIKRSYDSLSYFWFDLLNEVVAEKSLSTSLEVVE